MKALDAGSIYNVSLPPVPVSAKNGYPMFWHPEDEAFWILVVIEGQAREVWRVAHDGAGTRIFGEADLGFPKDFNNRYVTACLFYFDTVRQSPVWLTMDHANQLLIGVLVGKSFPLIEQANTIVPSTDDSFVFDPDRGVLVHFVGPSHRSSELEGERKARGGFTVRELGVDGVWREVGTPLPDFARYFATCAGWDERQKLAVAIALSDRRVVGWDGKDWHPLASLPEDPWQPSVLGIAPRTKGLTYLQKQRADRVYTALFWELTDRGWNKIDVGTLEEFGGMAYDPIHDEAVLYGAWFGAGTVQHTLARYDGTALVLAGRATPTISGGSIAGAPCFWGAREPGHGDYSSARSAYTARPVFSVKNGNYEVEPAAPPGIAVCADARARYAVGFEGEVHRFEAGSWKKISGTPKGFARRSDANLGLDGEGRILLVGGDPGASSSPRHGSSTGRRGPSSRRRDRRPRS